MKPIVSIENLHKRFCKGNVCVANEVSFSIQEGEIFTILGRSGSGKTTLLRMLSGLETPDSGTICIGDKVVFDAKTNVPPNQREIAIVFQNYALLPHLNIAQNIAFGSKADQKELLHVMQKTKIETLSSKYPHEISGGQQQRVALARAILDKPKILLLDEPLSNIDTELRAILRAELKEMIKRFGITALFITHDKEDAFFLSDRIAIMEGGDILQIGSPKEVYNHPNSLQCAHFLGKMNVLPQSLHVGEKEFYCRLDAVHLGGHLKHKAFIKEIVFYGNFYEISLDVEGELLMAYSFDDSLNVGQSIGFEIDKNKLMYFEG
ncbi:ABC transporter ATP-binding protein [Sulfurospirillum barnesii]|uniref:ABC-type spermidine/putrescine transport system, ATPase component n=1 Tax=Sulfurospirillum barnesii (strain ATCC 700032 / DSM 10660 / SES-3) TaxID=760154 RepID=I3Y0C7_SULBS|nr:ABC transporter ATP-binding protein [Sulfurospirillum barnesii]AFL69651.1 ABC-type spermidine/putrescine transport system, ATPase component [Sulfurospirillum barnesii SES-3]